MKITTKNTTPISKICFGRILKRLNFINICVYVLRNKLNLDSNKFRKLYIFTSLTPSIDSLIISNIFSVAPNLLVPMKLIFFYILKKNKNSRQLLKEAKQLLTLFQI